MDTSEQREVTRRSFLRGSAAIGAVAALGLAGAASVSGFAVADDKTAWDGEADIIIVGGGGGLLAACDAADAGNSVILLEKSARVGGECCLNEGFINGNGTSVQAAEGVSDTPDLQMQDYQINQAKNIDFIDMDILQTYVDNSGAAIERLIELGCEYVLAQDTVFYSTVPRAHIIQPNATAWGTVLEKACTDRGVQIMLETPMTSLIVDAEGAIVGVQSADKNFRAGKAVILATGDISSNERMKAKYQPRYASIAGAHAYNEGDGLFAALAVGADCTFNQNTAVGPCQIVKPEGSAIGFYQVLKGTIIVNSEGKRYANETDYSACAGLQVDQPDGAAWAIFDSRVAAMSHRPDCTVAEINGQLFAGVTTELGLISGVGPAYLEDFQKTDSIIEADSIAELAQACGIDPDGLAAQVETYNAAVAAGVDDEFGKPFSGAMQFGDSVGIEEGSFYAMPFIEPRWFCTEGPNLLVNTDMSVLDVKGEPIPRLYACGAGIAGGMGTLYCNSCGDHMGFTAISARIAAASAAAQTALEA